MAEEKVKKEKKERPTSILKAIAMAADSFDEASGAFVDHVYFEAREKRKIRIF